jgi:NitT/TauT family transport system substrate-binding protein
MKLTKMFIGVLAGYFIMASCPGIASDVISTEKMTIKMGYCPMGMIETPLAKAKQFYKKYLPDVEIEWHFGMYSLNLINDWIAGKIEIAYLGDTPSIILQNKTGNTKWVGVAVYAHGTEAAVFIPNDSKITSIRELDGKNIATGIGSSHHRILEVIGAKEGIKFNIISQFPDVGFENLKKGTVDGVCCWPPYIELGKQNKLGKPLLPDCTKYEPEVNAIWSIVVSEKFAKEHPLIVKGIVKADNDLHKFIKERLDEASDIVFKELEGKMPLSVIKASLANLQFSDTIEKEHIETMQRGIEFLKSKGIIKTGFNAADWAEPGFAK